MDHVIQTKNPIPPSRRPLEMASIWAVMATVLLSIFAFIPSSSAPFLPTKTFIIAAGALVALALYILARLGRGNIVVPPLLLLGCMWLPAAAYAISALLSGGSFQGSFWGTSLETDTLGFILAVVVLGSITALALRNIEHYRALLKGLFGIGALLLIVEVLVLLVGQFAPGLVPPSFSIVGSSEDLAVLLGLIILGGLFALRFFDLSGRLPSLLVGGIVASLVLLTVMGSVIVWVLVALIAFGFFVEAIMKRRAQTVELDLEETAVVSEAPTIDDKIDRPLIMPLLVLAVSLLFLIGGNLGTGIANSLHVNVLSVRPSWQATFTVLRKTYSASPILGSGPGTFEVDWLKYRDPSLNSTVFWNVDFSSGIGFLPTSFVTTGLLGLLAWLGFLGLFFWVGVRTLLLRAPSDPTTRFTAILSFAGAAYLFVAAFFDLPGPVVLMLAFVLAGVFISTLRFAQGAGQWGLVFAKAPRLSFGIVMLLTFALLGSVAFAYPLIENYSSTLALSRAAAKLSAGDLTGADAAVKSALSSAATPAANVAQANVASARLASILTSATTPAATAQQEFQAALSEGVQAALTATRVAPDQYQNWIALGNLYAVAVPLNISGAYEGASAAYARAQKLNPTSPQIPYLMAQLDIAHKDAKSAENDLKQAIGLKQDYTQAIILLSQLEVADGNVRDALQSALSAAYFTPNDPNILFQVGILRAATGDYNGAVQALDAAVAANPQFANARYFLAVAYAKLKDYQNALSQIDAVAALSPANATAVAGARASLAAGKDPFPANLLSASSTPVQ